MKTRYFKNLPKPYWTYPKILSGLLKKTEVYQPKLPEIEYIVDPFYIKATHLQTYNQICGFNNTGKIPAIYFVMLSQSLQMYMMTQEPFPFTVLGLVHISNKITQYHSLPANLQYGLSCRFGEVNKKSKGYEITFCIEVKLGDDVVVSAVSTYFYRQKTEIKNETIKKLEHKQNLLKKHQWKLQENLGRRYALVSGDLNFIHLHKWAAKSFGFDQAIAHGMWSKSMAMAHLDLPDSYTIYVEFKSPIFLPSTVNFLVAQQNLTTEFSILNETQEKTHMMGLLTIR